MMGEDRKVAALREAVEIYSPTGREDEMAKYLLELLSGMGGEAPFIDGGAGGNVVAIKGSGPPHPLAACPHGHRAWIHGCGT